MSLVDSVLLDRESSYDNALMSVLAGTLSKLATRWPPLISRVLLCFEKFEQRYRGSFHPSVHQRVTECLNLLRFPSIASAVFDSAHATRAKTFHVDADSPLPFLLRTSGDRVDAYMNAEHF